MCRLTHSNENTITAKTWKILSFTCRLWLVTCASMTNIRAPHPPNIISESNAGSKKSICPGKSHIWNCTNELFDISGKNYKLRWFCYRYHIYQIWLAHPISWATHSLYQEYPRSQIIWNRINLPSNTSQHHQLPFHR